MTNKFFASIIAAILIATALAFTVAVHRLHVQERAMGIAEVAR